MIDRKSKLLGEISEYTAPKVIIDAVCDKLAASYSEDGFKYLKSSRRLSKVIKDFTVEIVIWSFKSNTAGRFVTIDIKSEYYYKKSKLSKKRKGTFTLSDRVINTIDMNSPIKTNYYIDGTSKSFNDGTGVRYSSTVDIFNITYELFDKIIEYIDRQISFVEKLYDSEFLNEFVYKLGYFDKQSLLREDFAFMEFINDYYGSNQWMRDLLTRS